MSNLPPYDGPWKVGNEYLPYHSSASHAPPDLRDCWNRCYWAGRAFAEEAVRQEREAYRELWTAAARVALSNGFDAAYPENLDALKSMVQSTRGRARSAQV